jgi:hypothetical protein
LEIKFENHIWNLFEIIQTGGKLNKMNRTEFELNWADFKLNPNGPAHKMIRSGREMFQTALTGGAYWSDYLTAPNRYATNGF